MKKLIKTLILIFVVPTTINAQISLNNEITLPSTDVWNFMKYGDVGTNLYTGTLNLKIPVYTYKDADFEIPISIDYSSNGYMPNIRTGILGLGWNLNVGGYITREIKGLPDDLYTNKIESIGDHIPPYGVVPLYSQYQLTSFTSRWELYNTQGFVPTKDNLYPVTYSNFNLLFKDNASPYFFDAEPDIYHFNFMGYSGSFHLGYNHGELYVYNTNANNNEFKIDFRFPFITITTKDGYKYNFGATFTQNLLRKSCDELTTIITDGQTYTTQYPSITAFKLLEIITPNNRKAQFYYNENFTSTNYEPNHSIKKVHKILWLNPRHQDPAHLIPYDADILDIYNPDLQTESYVYSNTTTKILDYIQIDNGVEIKFEYEPPVKLEKYSYGSYLYEILLKKIKKIKVTDSNSDIIRVVDMTYKHPINENSNQICLLNTINISGEGSYSMKYYKEDDHTTIFPFYGKCSTDHWEYYNGANTLTWQQFAQSIQIKNKFYDDTPYRNPNAEYAKIGMLKEMTYPTKGKSVFEYEAHNYSQKVDRNVNGVLLKSVTIDSITGGLRIKKITNYLENGNESEYKEFFYVNENNRSSGRLLYKPHYSMKFADSYSGAAGDNFLERLESYSLSGLLPIGSTHIEYDRIVEKNKDNSKVIYNYSNYSNMPDQFIYINDGFNYDEKENFEITDDCVKYPNATDGYMYNYCWMPPIVGAISLQESGYNDPKSYRYLLLPANSMQAERGKLLSKQTFDSNGNLLLNETNSYNIYKQLKYFPTPVYLAREYGFYKRYIDNFDITGTTKTQRIGNNEINENVSYTYNSHGQISTTTKIDSKGDKIVTKQKYVTDITNPSGIYKKMLDNNVINEPIEDSVYIIKSGTTEKTLVEWHKYNYYQPDTSKESLIRLQYVDEYDRKESAWVRTAIFVHDKNGRVLEQTDRNGIKTSYIWGYNGLYIVAKVENCGLNQVKNISGLANIETASLPAGISDYESALRNIPEAEVTTLEYYPFVGLKKVTDPSGKVMMYDYNATGKLRTVVDDENNLFNKYYYSTDDKN